MENKNNNPIVSVLDKSFELSIPYEKILKEIEKIAYSINNEYINKKPVFVIVLNGAFIFASDLIKQINLECETVFIRLSSYEGTQTTKKITEVIGITESLENRDVIIVEDIIDTGITMDYLLNLMDKKKVKSAKIATLLFKKEKFEKNFPVDYIGFTIPDSFILGYGLDYNGYGRNLKDIYSIIENN